MEFKDITTWTISADHKARPKNENQKGQEKDFYLRKSEELNWGEYYNKIWREFETFATQHTFACSETLLPGDYPVEDVELVWQVKEETEIDWTTENTNAYNAFVDYNDYAIYAASCGCFETRQYLQLKQPVKEQEIKTIMKLTVKEAIEQGFEYAGKKDTGWQNYDELTDLHPIDVESGNYYLASKEKTHPFIDEKSLLELITEDIDCRFCDETGCDDSTVSDALHGLDLTSLVKEINERLSVIWSSTLTDIELIP